MDVLIDGEIILFGTVGENLWGDGFTDRDVVDALARHGRGKDVTVRINSGGGYTAHGVAIFNALKAHRGKVTCIVEAVAASAASVIAMAGDERIMRAGSLMMIHDPSVITFGNKRDHEKSMEVLEELAESMADIYSEASGRSVKQVRKDMEEEVWLTASKAVKMGYATSTDKQEDTPEPTAFDYTLYRNAPKEFVALAKDRAWNKPVQPTAELSAPSGQPTKETTMTDPAKPVETAPAAPAAPATPPAAPAAPAAPTASNVVELSSAKQQGYAEALAYVAEVNDICKLAGASAKAGEFIANKTPLAEVRKALVDAKASADAAATTAALAPNAGADKTAGEVVSKAVAKINQRFAARN